MKKASKTNTTSIGSCGEYFVAAELERNGYTAALPMANTANFDILAIHRETNKQIAIQVKTNHTAEKTWTLSVKNENLIAENIYYVFVSLNGLCAPDYYILPSALVAASIHKVHTNFLSAKKEDGSFKKDTSIRKFSFEIQKYNPFHLCEKDYRGNWGMLTEAYGALTQFLPIFNGDFFGTWHTDKTGDGSETHPIQIPYFNYTDEIEDFISAVYKFIDDHPEMNLHHYREILKDNQVDIETIKDVDVSNLNANCVCAMIVANVIAERICEGAILTSCKDKTFTKWLRQLKKFALEAQ